ncbi:hypothetical protein [Prevotella histicola]
MKSQEMILHEKALLGFSNIYPQFLSIRSKSPLKYSGVSNRFPNI